jgi:hypothetical protein
MIKVLQESGHGSVSVLPEDGLTSGNVSRIPLGLRNCTGRVGDTNPPKLIHEVRAGGKHSVVKEPNDENLLFVFLVEDDVTLAFEPHKAFPKSFGRSTAVREGDQGVADPTKHGYIFIGTPYTPLSN